jgi:hypothetical protein
VPPPPAQAIPGLVRLPRPLPPGIPEEQQYIQQYCAARGLPYPLQVGVLGARSRRNWHTACRGSEQHVAFRQQALCLMRC